MASRHPNPAQTATTDREKRLKPENLDVKVITRNIDEFHFPAGFTNVLKLHGTFFKTRCTWYLDILVNRVSPMSEALVGKCAPDLKAEDTRFPDKKLPLCIIYNCGGLLWPDIVWFGESLDDIAFYKAQQKLDHCDLCFVEVYPLISSRRAFLPLKWRQTGYRLSSSMWNRQMLLAVSAFTSANPPGSDF